MNITNSNFLKKITNFKHFPPFFPQLFKKQKSFPHSYVKTKKIPLNGDFLVFIERL